MNTNTDNPEFSSYGDCSNEQYDPEWWFPVEKSGRVTWSRTYEANTARGICKSCPILLECTKYALQYRGLSGIWGGMDRHERHDMQKALNIIPKSWEMTYTSPMWGRS